MRRIRNKRMVGQREENGKGAHSQPLLMQIVATLKESKERQRKCFLMVWWANTHALRLEGGSPKKRVKRKEKERQQVKRTVIPTQNSCYSPCELIWTLWRGLYLEMYPLPKSEPLLSALSPLFKLDWQNRVEAKE